MPRTNSSELRGCTACSRSGADTSLLECLACLRDGKDHEGQAFCSGNCFQRHWRSHRDRKLEQSISISSVTEPSIDNKYSLQTLRASSQPFQPINNYRSPLQQHHRASPVASRVLPFQNGIMQASVAMMPYGQHNAQPILATGPPYHRR